MNWIHRNVPVLQLVASVIGLISLILIWLQLLQTQHWNQVDVQNTLLGNLPSHELEEKVWALVVGLGQYPHYEISPKVAKKLRDDLKHRLLVKTYLNKFEDFAGAVRAGRIDNDYAFRIHAVRIARTHCVYIHFIAAARDEFDNPMLYVELEMLAQEWSKRHEALSTECPKKTSDP